MELRPPTPTSNEESYGLLGPEETSAGISLPSAIADQPFTSDVASLPMSDGATGKTVISDPVVVCRTGSEPPAVTQAVEPSHGPESVSTPAVPVDGRQLIPAAPPSSSVEALASDRVVARSKFTPRLPKLRPRRRRVRLRYIMQAWTLSLVVHLVILSALAAATFAPEVVTRIVNFNSALAGHRNGEPEVLPIYADPDNIARDKALGDENASKARELIQVLTGDGGSDGGVGLIVARGVGTAAPSATPSVRGVGKGRINESSSLPGIKIDGLGAAPLSLLPLAPAVDLGGGGKIAGDPVFEVKEIGVALDQLAREILRHLQDHKLTVVWLFDESVSMQDDQKAILQKFDRVSSELKLNTDPKKKAAGALNHAIVGFGQGVDYVLGKPQEDIDQIGRAIKRLKVDSTGTENTMHAVREIVERYAALIKKDRRLLIVLVTDESGDDGVDVEEARQALKKYKVPLYVIGRQSLFGYPYAHHRYVDPVTKDVYHPWIRRGPETADFEVYQWDGLYERWDEQPSGFAPYELARLTKDSGGIYFVLPSEEFMRVRQREQAYSITQLKEYLPEYDNRLNYVEKRNSLPLRRLLYAIVLEGKGLLYRRDFPIEPEELVKVALEEGQKATLKLNILLDIQNRLEALAKIRDREPEKRWQAHYDLMLAQTVAFQVKAYEYRALMASIVKVVPTPKRPAGPDLVVTWVVNHSQKPLAPKNDTGKKYVEAERLLKEIVIRHPKTPWADLAQDTLNRGFSVQFDEWHHNAKYQERSQFVPKY